MNNYPNLIPYGYEIKTELGRNREGGRITWKGVINESQQVVVIKQFCFAVASSTWSGYKAYEQEIKVLRQLEHPNIPKYLGSIETDDGFCLIQEYIPASNLNDFRQLSLPEVIHVASNILKILVYLQGQNPPVLHRDLQPANILVNDSLQIFLIDFGFATLGSQEVSGSSVFKGTPGFIAPEQIIKPTPASDIYSLGVTLVCLLARKNITEIRHYASLDDPYQLKLQPLFPLQNRKLISWLEKMTNAKPSKRFSDALTAKAALVSLVDDLDLDLGDLNTNADPDLETVSNLTLTDSSVLDEFSVGGKPISIASEELNVTMESPWQVLVKPSLIAGTMGTLSLTTIAAWSTSFMTQRIEPTLTSLAIAIVGAVAIGITQLGAAAIVKSEPQAKLQGVAIAIAIPVLLVILSSLFGGIEEAVIMATAIAIIEIAIFTYFCWQIPTWQGQSPLVKLTILSGAIALGFSLGA